MTMTGLQRASVFPKPHDYKQKVQKMKGLLKNWVLTGKQFEEFRQKKFKISTPPMENPTKEAQDPKGKNWTLTHANRMKQTQAKMKKSFRIKLLDFCKTRTKKSSPDQFSFYVISAGHEMAKEAGRATTWRRSFKAHEYKQNVQKMKGILKKRALTGNSLNFSNQKTKKTIHRMENKTKEPQDPSAKAEHETCSQEEINWSKIEKSFQNNTVWTLQD